MSLPSRVHQPIISDNLKKKNKEDYLKYPMELSIKPLPSIIQKIALFEQKEQKQNLKISLSKDKGRLSANISNSLEHPLTQQVNMSTSVPTTAVQKDDFFTLVNGHTSCKSQKDRQDNIVKLNYDNDQNDPESSKTPFCLLNQQPNENRHDFFTELLFGTSSPTALLSSSSSPPPWEDKRLPTFLLSHSNPTTSSLNFFLNNIVRKEEDGSKNSPILENRNCIKQHSPPLSAFDKVSTLQDAHPLPGLPKSNSQPKFECKDPPEAWSIPTSVDQVREFRKKVDATHNQQIRLDLCRNLMATASDLRRSQSCEAFLSAPASSEPLLRATSMSSMTHDTLKKKRKEDLTLEEALLLEAQRILKRLAGNTIGHRTDSDALFMLANCYGAGSLGLPVDDEKAFSLYLYASKQSNHAESIYRAGVCYELGIGTKRDPYRAMTFYRKAATQHCHAASMYKLGIILLCGLYDTQSNSREAVVWLQRAAAITNEQNPHAIHALAMIQLSNNDEFNRDDGRVHNTTAFIADPAYAVELLRESAELGYAPSQAKLGELHEVGPEGVVEVDDALSIYWYTRAAEQGNADASLALSFWYLTGSSVLDQSDRQAYLWARKAAECQNVDRWTLSKAFFLIGTYIEKNIGTDDRASMASDAHIWFVKAAALGHLGAMKSLEKKLKL
ncbi:MAG: hypothetical protein EXX96DRAFT_587867 [Benjaminiella poitrasii]|nr:MAG: hypothetical protein EXX96DRAFT_587867 [Benjaminiella poitrasii]